MRIEYIDHMGSDLSVANAARVSMDKWKTVIDNDDVKLIHYLARQDPMHWTPFAHVSVTARVTVPFFVANQLKRHQVGFALNEVSRRYVDDEPDIYYPPVWRARPEKSIKQGSGGNMSEHDQHQIKADYAEYIESMTSFYNDLINRGVAPEQARLVLPQSAYTSWIWTGSLVAWARVYYHRSEAHAQHETREIAFQIDKMMLALPVISSWGALTQKGART
jgi:thymidylate synthase (FAD)